MSYKKLYSHFLEGHTGKLHMACHSHHFWPDITRQAMLDYWDDSAKLSDQKWDDIFEKKIPLLQKHVAKNLNIDDPKQVVFAPNTHDLVIRLLSTLDYKKKPRVLTTTGEFHSFSRQIKRLEEEQAIEVVRVPSFPSNNFWQGYREALKSGFFDLVFISHVFYNSGTSIGSLEDLVDLAKDHGKIVIDGYHSYFALPVDLSQIQTRAYFMAGHYKYAQAGEGMCFLACPKSNERPVITGWFASFEALAGKSNQVTYPAHAGQFLGSTMDFSPLYKALSVYELFEKEGVTVRKIHQYVQTLQSYFLKLIKDLNHPVLNTSKLLNDGIDKQGHFLAFKFNSIDECIAISQRLTEIGILTDSRENVLRFGFALYQETSDLDRIKHF